MTDKKIIQLDVVRALCAIEITCYWHMHTYLGIHGSNGLETVFGGILTKLALIGFVFISGVLLAKYSFGSVANCKSFYKKRLTRFYPLFLLSALSLYIGGLLIGKPWFESEAQLLTLLTGLGVFYPHRASTLWFIGMLFFFYLLTPLLAWDKRSIRIAGVIGLLIVMAALAVAGVVRQEYLWYFVAYCLGLLSGKRLLAWLSGRNSLVGRSERLSKLFYLLSYSSMAAYLFHRQIYEVIRILIPGHVFPMWSLVLIIPLMWSLSYGIQKGYDLAFRCSERSHRSDYFGNA